jgi:hypothetical protein
MTPLCNDSVSNVYELLHDKWSCLALIFLSSNECFHHLQFIYQPLQISTFQLVTDEPFYGRLYNQLGLISPCLTKQLPFVLIINLPNLYTTLRHLINSRIPQLV